MKKTIENNLAEHTKTKNQIRKLKAEIKKSKRNIKDAMTIFGKRTASAYIAQEEDKIETIKKKIEKLSKKEEELRKLCIEQLTEIEESSKKED